ncbi:DUF572-domain-containing protein [Gonapodya prolifera JEL478]|uniref:Splicing factor YJU2 n=1 Tax=Gonapodya prolifera (strain JEL478) TaxID=1344416 RepID=A0A138ZYJ5_GONPJ|nr:DUF572-domain-containing protein [Gonapodya prolifera JEL478]|eukprot:KXS09576.1 DUF572-domain-containing protein [Gonapodya prolifera JEL478]
MSERKVLNKYFPPDFDPAKIPRRKRPKNFQYTVRLMAPFSMQCKSCGNWIPKSTKFNARKETVHGEDYLGIRIFRFYIRCPRCSSEITFKTDPKNTDYVCEQGASRNFEHARAESRETERLAEMRQQEEAHNPMKALENRTVDSKREMDILDALDEIRTRNAAQERVDSDQVLAEIAEKKQEAMMRLKMMEDEEIERMAKEAFSGRLHTGTSVDNTSAKYDTDTATGAKVRRLMDAEDPGIDEDLPEDDALYDQTPGYFSSGDAAGDGEDDEEERHLLALKSKYGSARVGSSAAVAFDGGSKAEPKAKAANSVASTLGVKRKADFGLDLGVVVKRKGAEPGGGVAKKASEPASDSSLQQPRSDKAPGGLLALGMYGDDSGGSGDDD